MLAILGSVYHEAIYRPLLNLLVFFHNIIPGHDIGLVIVLLTVFIRLLLAPSFHKSLKSQSAMNALQPKLNELREKHKNDKEGQAKAMMELYKEHKINPLSSCLPLLIQLPILIALYQVFRTALGGNEISGLYHFVKSPGFINPKFLGLIDLSRIAIDKGIYYIPGIVLAVLAGATQFWQSKLMMPKTGSQDATAKAMSWQTTYFLPLISVYFAMKFPAGLAVYWVVTTLFAVGQQYYIMRKQPKISG